MDGSGASEKIIHNLPPHYLQMLALLQMIASNFASRGFLRAVLHRLPYQPIDAQGAPGEIPRFVPYWVRAQLLVEGKMGHDGDFL